MKKGLTDAASAAMAEATISPQRYYDRQSRITDPREQADLFAGLPETVPELCAVVQGLLLHYEEGPLYQVRIPRERTAELNLRWVSAMLARIRELDDRPLIVARAPDRRLVGCCRDFAVLLTAVLRHQGVPARACYGFAAYLNHPSLTYCDHVVCEYWNAAARRWVLVDPLQDELHRQLNWLAFDPCDVPRERFLTAAEAWQRCRAGLADPDDFGYTPDARGLWVVRTYLVHDLAARNGMELLLQDGWGLANARERTVGERDLALLDRVAALTLADDQAFPALSGLYESSPRLCVPPVVTCVDIVRGARRRVQLDRDHVDHRARARVTAT